MKTYCRICEAACGLVATVEDGAVTKLVPDREHPVSAGHACAKGTPLAQCTPATGKLICRSDPVYGGTGNPAIESDPRFDEEGYIAIPDCFWGDAQYGLAPPIELDGVPLHVVKISNATWGHYGEMSGGQPWVVTPA